MSAGDRRHKGSYARASRVVSLATLTIGGDGLRSFCASRSSPFGVAEQMARRIVCACGWSGGLGDLLERTGGCPACGEQEALRYAEGPAA